MQVRDRIKELRRVRTSELRPNPRNWRLHSDDQRNALRGILAEVGFADALLARELEDGTLELIDGHLRAETLPDQMVPVLIIDVDETEANKLLATLDPLGAMATTDSSRLTALLSECEFDNVTIEGMLQSLLEEPEASGDVSDIAVGPPCEIPRSYQVVVECRDEEQQESIYEQLTVQGHRCRVLTM